MPVTELSKEEQKDLPLTWEQLEAFGQDTNRNHVLEVRVSSLLEDAEAWCYDRVQKLKRVRLPPVLGQALREMFHRQPSIRWAMPKFRPDAFEDGDTGVMILQEDLGNVSILLDESNTLGLAQSIMNVANENQGNERRDVRPRETSVSDKGNVTNRPHEESLRGRRDPELAESTDTEALGLFSSGALVVTIAVIVSVGWKALRSS